MKKYNQTLPALTTAGWIEVDLDRFRFLEKTPKKADCKAPQNQHHTDKKPNHKIVHRQCLDPKLHHQTINEQSAETHHQISNKHKTHCGNTSPYEDEAD